MICWGYKTSQVRIIVGSSDQTNTASFKDVTQTTRGPEGNHEQSLSIYLTFRPGIEGSTCRIGDRSGYRTQPLQCLARDLSD
jgi:hypothetical protein